LNLHVSSDDFTYTKAEADDAKQSAPARAADENFMIIMVLVVE